jgi:tRNA pseudouridine38-40 synthase
MQAWKLLIEYEGTRYSGWQKQTNARTVQGELIKAAEKVLSGDIELSGSGRTDAGVHALGQVAHLKTKANKTLSPRQIQLGLNDNLPADINILKVEKTDARFHARHHAAARYYIYQIATRRTAFGKPFVWWIKDRLDAASMARAAEMLVGRHDFTSFSEKDKKETSPIVHVEHSNIFETGGLICFRIGASHFLWKMVRRLVGTLAEVGRGNITVADFESYLANKSKEPAVWTAPPSGLFLEKVLYDKDQPPTALEPVFPI